MAITLFGAEVWLARGQSGKAWAHLERIEGLLGQRWPIEHVPGSFNLQAAVTAFANKQFQRAYDCAMAARREFEHERRRLGPSASAYLIYYAVAVARSALGELGSSIRDDALAYPTLLEVDIASVDRRWRRKFPLANSQSAPRR